jgi:hypothetical protein
MIVDTSALIAILRDAPNSYRAASPVMSQNLPIERSSAPGAIAIIVRYNYKLSQRPVLAKRSQND